MIYEYYFLCLKSDQNSFISIVLQQVFLSKLFHRFTFSEELYLYYINTI